MQYLVRRGLGLNSQVLKLGDREFARGASIDTSEFPEFVAADWKRWESHRLIESVDAQTDERVKAERRHAAELQRARGRFGAESSEPVTATVPASDASCSQCEFVAKTPHGLLVHAGRKHREPTEATPKE